MKLLSTQFMHSPPANAAYHVIMTTIISIAETCATK